MLKPFIWQFDEEFQKWTPKGIFCEDIYVVKKDDRYLYSVLTVMDYADNLHLALQLAYERLSEILLESSSVSFRVHDIVAYEGVDCFVCDIYVVCGNIGVKLRPVDPRKSIVVPDRPGLSATVTFPSNKFSTYAHT